MKFTSGDLLLLFLFSKGNTEKQNEPITGRTRLMKMTFVFEKEFYADFCKDKCLIEESDLPNFFAWDYGPMSSEVLRDLEFFVKIGFVQAIQERNSYAFEEAAEFSYFADEDSLEGRLEQEYVFERYTLTNMGVKYVEQNLFPLLSDSQKSLLEELKKRFNGASLAKILEYVYRKYPTYTEKSKILDKVLNT